MGSHAGEEKLGGVYVSLACLPPYMTAKLKNIFISTIFYAKHLKLFNNENFFRKSIEDLQFLSKKGLQIKYNGSDLTVYFQCVQILGDNAGLNRICGFSQSFKASYFCRICSASNVECQQMIEETDSLLRTHKSYEADVKTNNAKQTGVKEECIFNKVDKFDITENISVDLMHDVPEGTINYTVSKVVDCLINDNVITLETINYRIETFQYNDQEISNKPRPLFFSQRKKGERR